MSDLNYLKCSNEFTFKGRQFNGYTTVEQLNESCNFQFLPTDIIISTFARSGTTFVQEIVWQIKNHKTSKKDEKFENTIKRFPFLEFNYTFLPFITESFAKILDSQRNNDFRLIKTHVPYEFIRENFEKVNPKMIVVMRNAKDCLVSNFYHYTCIPLHGWNGTFDEFFPIFLNGKTYTGCYFDNNLEWWSLRDKKNVLILFYEDLLTNLSENVVKIALFLGENLSNDDIDKVVYNSSFSTMFKNPNINAIPGTKYTMLRKGVAGDWKKHFSEEQNQLIDKKIAEKFEDSGLNFIYE